MSDQRGLRYRLALQLVVEQLPAPDALQRSLALTAAVSNADHRSQA
jgi:hypothetical protein